MRNYYLVVTQMYHSVTNLLRSALITEIAYNVAAGTPCNIHLALVTVAALGAFPHQLAVVLDDLDLAVVAAALAVVGLGV